MSVHCCHQENNITNFHFGTEVLHSYCYCLNYERNQDNERQILHETSQMQERCMAIVNNTQRNHSQNVQLFVDSDVFQRIFLDRA